MMNAPELEPSGCATCGFPKRSHHFAHAFVPPIQAEILLRMRKRRELRRDPNLRDKPPMVPLYLGHRLKRCEPAFFGAHLRWVCVDCSRYTARSGGTEYGSAVTEPCKAHEADLRT